MVAQNIQLFKKFKQTSFLLTLCYSINVLSKTLLIFAEQTEKK